MFCRNCGNEITEGTVCPNCGADSAGGAEAAVSKKKSLKPLIITILIVVVVAIVAAVGAVIAWNASKVRLNEDEQRVFDALVESSDAFYSPETLKVLQCSKIYTDDDEQNNGLKDESAEHCYLKINAQVKMGGKNTVVYCLSLESGSLFTADDVKDINGYGEGDAMDKLLDIMYPDFEIQEVADNIDIAKINKAYSKYLEENGWK